MNRHHSSLFYYAPDRFGIEIKLLSLICLHLLIWLPLLYFIRRRKKPAPEDGSPPQDQPIAPIPWHESDTFRTGLFILPLLMWAWVDSLGHHSTVEVGIPSPTHYSGDIGSQDSQIIVNFSSVGPSTSSSDDPLVISQTRSPAGTYSRGLGLTLPTWFHSGPGDDDRESSSHPGVIPSSHTRLSLPYWLVITGHILLFTAILRYRFTRQRRRQLLPTTPLQAQTD